MNIIKSLAEYEQLLVPVRKRFCGKSRRTSNKVELERGLFGIIPIALLRAGVANDRTG